MGRFEGERGRSRKVALPTKPPPDLLEAFEERAAIMEYCGGMTRHEAERKAWGETFRNRFLKQRRLL